MNGICTGSCPMEYVTEWQHPENPKIFYRVYICKKCGVLCKRLYNNEGILVSLRNKVEEL